MVGKIVKDKISSYYKVLDKITISEEFKIPEIQRIPVTAYLVENCETKQITILKVGNISNIMSIEEYEGIQ